MLSPLGSWRTALDFDFTAQGTQVLSPDGPYVLGGLNFIKGNSAADATAMQNTAGTGLVIKPAAASDYNGSTRTEPYLWLGFSQIPALPQLAWDSAVRVWFYIASDNGAANFDNFCSGIDTNSVHYGYLINRGHGATNIGLATQQIINSAAVNGFVSGNPLTIGATNDVVVIEMPSLLGFMQIAKFGAHALAGIWPPESALLCDSMGQQGASASNTFFTPNVSNITPQSLGIILGAKRAGSGTAYNCTIGRVRLDYRL
jgi:hypothetical protein